MAKFNDNGKSFKVRSPIVGQGKLDLANFANNGESAKARRLAKMVRGSLYKVLSWIEPSVGSHLQRNPKSSPEFLFRWEPTEIAITGSILMGGVPNSMWNFPRGQWCYP